MRNDKGDPGWKKAPGKTGKNFLTFPQPEGKTHFAKAAFTGLVTGCRMKMLA